MRYSDSNYRKHNNPHSPIIDSPSFAGSADDVKHSNKPAITYPADVMITSLSITSGWHPFIECSKSNSCL